MVAAGSGVDRRPRDRRGPSRAANLGAHRIATPSPPRLLRQMPSRAAGSHSDRAQRGSPRPPGKVVRQPPVWIVIAAMARSQERPADSVTQRCTGHGDQPRTAGNDLLSSEARCATREAPSQPQPTSNRNLPANRNHSLTSLPSPFRDLAWDTSVLVDGKCGRDRSVASGTGYRRGDRHLGDGPEPAVSRAGSELAVSAPGTVGDSGNGPAVRLEDS